MIREMWSVLVRTMAGIAAIAVVAVANFVSASTDPASLATARIGHYHGALELHFGFDGVVPRWNLRTQGSALMINLPWTTTQLPPRPLYGQEIVPLKSVRIKSVKGTTQIAIEVDGVTDYAVARLKHEIVLRLATAGTVPNIAAPILVRDEDRPAALPEIPQPQVQSVAKPVVLSPTLPAKSSRPAEESAAQQQLSLATESAQAMIGHPLVMIDPGHGGYDPGTSSTIGTQEKDLALAIALRLQQSLQTQGFRAEMTRSSDFFVPLPERTKIANRANADLFISIHLNSSPNPTTTGIEVYYLNNTTDHSTIRLARIENAGAPASYGTDSEPNLNYILTDLRQQYKANEAASIARMIDAQAAASLDAGLGTNVNALGAKMGPFYVLVGAHMPAVLVETGFLSNAVEARRLASPQYQELLADGIATAIAHYFNADVAVGNL